MHKNTLILAVIAAAFIISACGGTATPNANTNTAVANANTAVDTTKPKINEPENDAPTLSPVYKAYCAAAAKNDEAAIRKLYTAATLKNFEEQMKEMKEKSLLKFLEDDKPTGGCEVKNEDIKGDTAIARIFSNLYPKGLRVTFEKEGGEWKMTNKVPDLESVKSTSNSNGNTAK